MGDVGWTGGWEGVVTIDGGGACICPVFCVCPGGQEEGANGGADYSNAAFGDAVEGMYIGRSEGPSDGGRVAKFEETR